ncbi:MAG: ribosomal RNA small subunit methyltransferase A [Desulfobacula sp. RIFOXYB2_FULL_45_6]|nr:MAG: ribosomal RNA small subunit methyltransferase A [Desulfobacula sp. RIFOXYB2_FULL_45_6]
MTHPGQLLKQAGLYAGKELGQNFLSNPGTARMIVEKTGISEDMDILEIGPGLGALTLPIAKKAFHVTAVEKDGRLIPILRDEIDASGLKNIDIIHQDVLKIHIKDIVKDKKLVVIGNLPYNISSQILFKLVEERGYIEKAFLMFQKELATRILAPPGGRDYSRLSAVSQFAAKISPVAEIGPSSFFPSPDVNSSILRFQFFQSEDFDQSQEKLLFDVIKAAFSKRRKSLKNSMAGGELEYEKEFVLQVLARAGIDAQRRAETLSVEEFKSLTRAIRETGG